jgi:methylase of polypeptide subunit release factors
MPPTIPPEIRTNLQALTRGWATSEASERQLFQPWLIQFCKALELPPPGSPPTGDDCFERSVEVIDRQTGREGTNFIDYWKAGHVAIEAKASGNDLSNDALLRKAYGQVRNYVAEFGSPPPYLIVVDVPRTLIIWDRWNGRFGDFAAGRRIALGTLHERPDDIALLRDVFSNPAARDPRGKAQAVSRDIAGKLATLSATFERRGLDSERVARFLMRCVFCFFAEDVDLLPKHLFKRTLETARSSGDPERVAQVLTGLWQTMDQGGMFGAELLHRFNGHFFKAVEALPLEPADVSLLIEAAQFDWSAVEPSIFGTLLVRALDPVERHRLGAEYTPREYIERLVEPTVVEPIRERWTAVTAAVVQLEESGKKKDRESALKQLRDFHAWLRGLSFLDPACGSGNFLYVTMAAVKRIELEVIHEIERVGGKEQKEAILEEVHPRQFHGIEIKPWAREIAELTLWIGYHQFWREAHGGRTPPDPILEDTGTIECRDAVLAWDEIVHRPERDRPDPTPRITSPVTGELIPDPTAKLKYMEYVNPRPAEWPKTDFIVGNPPYVGEKRQRDALGDGYVEALRSAYTDLPDNMDFVMYWWWRAARRVEADATIRAGLITTNSIRQIRSRGLIASAARSGVHLVWAIADHPWTNEIEGAAIRVAMTVVSRMPGSSTLVAVDSGGRITTVQHAAHLNPDLTIGVDVATAASVAIRANHGISNQGYKLAGRGFVLSRTEARDLLAEDRSNSEVVRPFANAGDLVDRPDECWVIDFGLLQEAEVKAYAHLFQIVHDRLFGLRQGRRSPTQRETWWRFDRPRPDLRAALVDLPRFIATPEVARRRFFCFLPAGTAPDGTLVAIASSSAFIFGVLSSLVHTTWATAAAGKLGVGNDPRYSKTVCFDPFPFPAPAPNLRAKIGALAERLDTHRKDAIARDERVTMTGMYNVIEKLRNGDPLTPKERAIHEIAACGVLRDLHDELDALVAEAYGWPWPMEKEEILERLVQLHDERVAEEKQGKIRWLRPDYQIPRFAPKSVAAKLDLPEPAAAPATEVQKPWPGTAVEQLTAIGALVAQRPMTAEEVVAAFDSAKGDLVERHLDTLALMGEVIVDAEGRYGVSRKAA